MKKQSINSLISLILCLCLILPATVPGKCKAAETLEPKDTILLTLDGLSEDIEVLKSEYYANAMLGYDYIKESGISGAGIKIAVIDSGLSSNFSEHTYATILEGTNYTVAENSADRHNTGDNLGHGTFVTSLICSSEAGIAAGVTILPLKAFDGSTADISNTVEAIYDAVDVFDCDIINLSLGGSDESQALNNAVKHALDKGVIVVAASGNLSSSVNSTGEDVLMYPAALDGVIGVGAVDKTRTVWVHSIQNSSVDFVAPGVSMQGLSNSTGQIRTWSGTSFSTPIVTATVALALSIDSSLTPETLTNLLIQTSEDLGEEGRDNSYGYGIINPALLVATLIGDEESLILSYWNGNTAISGYRQEGNNNILSTYDANGKMSGLQMGIELKNYILSEDISNFSIFSVNEDTFAPTTVVRK